jgi:succinate dehydrogenase hydrophobic anchor subunit
MPFTIEQDKIGFIVQEISGVYLVLLEDVHIFFIMLYCFANIIVLLKQNKSISVQHIAQFVSAK